MAAIDALRQELVRESRRHYAAYVLLNQAIAASLDLHPTDVQVLSLLAMEDRPQPVGVIAAITGLTTGSATRVVDRLERAGHARRVADPDDGRKVLVELGETTVDDAWQTPGRAFSEATGRYSADELAVILDYLRRVGDVGRDQTERLAEDRRSPRRRAASD